MIISFLLIGQLLYGQNVLDLTTCRNLAFEHNHNLRSARLDIEIAQQKKKSSFAGFLPEFELSSEYTRLGDPSAMSSPGFELRTLQGDPSGVYYPPNYVQLSPEDNYKVNMGVVQPLYMGGKIRNGYKLSKLGESISQTSLRLTSSEILSLTDEQYWRVVSMKEKVELANKARKLLKELMDNLNNRYEVGLATRNDLLKAKVSYNEADLKLLKARNGLVLSKMALNQTIGLQFDSIVNVKDSIVGNFGRLVDVHEGIAKALSKRPELKMLEDQLQMGKTQVKIARGDMLPNLMVMANYYYSNPNHLGEADGEYSWNAIASCNIPVFHWGEKRHKVKEKKLELKKSHVEVDQTKEFIILDVQQAVFSLNESVSKVSMTQESLEQAQENLDLGRNNFELGMVTLTDLLDAQLQWQNAYSEFIDAKVEYMNNLTAYQKSIGELEID
jgi:outer membrane protein TolC